MNGYLFRYACAFKTLYKYFSVYLIFLLRIALKEGKIDEIANVKESSGT